MAYVDQNLKAKLAPAIKALCKEHGVSASVAVRNHMVLVVNIKSGKLDFIDNTVEAARKFNCGSFATEFLANYIHVNTHHIPSSFSGECAEFLTKLHDLMNIGNHDRSDIQSDYFNVGWYTDINIGKWNKPYILTK